MVPLGQPNALKKSVRSTVIDTTTATHTIISKNTAANTNDSAEETKIDKHAPVSV